MRFPTLAVCFEPSQCRPAGTRVERRAGGNPYFIFGVAMQVTHVAIRNFRGIRDASLDLSKFHVLVGENGSGKTSVLEAIRLATTPAFPYSTLCEQDFHNTDEGPISVAVTFDVPFAAKLEDGFNELTLLCNGVDLTIKRREAASAGKALSEPFVSSQLCRPIVYGSYDELADLALPDGVALEQLPPAVKRVPQGFLITRKALSERNVREGALNLNLELVGYPIVFYFDRKREKESKHGFNTLFTRITKDLNWRYRKKWTPDVADQLWSAYYTDTVGTVAEKKKSQLLDKIRPRLTQLLGWSFDDLELSLLNLEEPFARAFIAKRNGLNQVDVEGMGSGLAAVLSYCLLEQISRLAKQDVVFLIDEPELHLHLQVQRRLCDDFRRAEHQVIVSSHSAAFVCLDNWDGLTRIEAGGACFPTDTSLTSRLEGRPVRDHLADIRAFHQHHTIFSDADADLLFAARVILVEGPAEKYGLPRLARLIGLELDGMTIVSCNGKSKIAHYALLCHAYGIEPFVLFDRDGKALEDESNRVVISRIGTASFFAFSKSFEHELGIGANSPHKGSAILLKIDDATSESLSSELMAALDGLRHWLTDAQPEPSARLLFGTSDRDEASRVPTAPSAPG